MNHHPPQPPIVLRSTTPILKRTTLIFTSHLLTFLFLSSLVFVFRSNVENGTQYLTSFIDRDPSLKSLLSRLDISGRTHYQHLQHRRRRHHHHPHPHPRHIHRRRRPFLHLSRIGTLDDDFFSGDEDYDRSLFGSPPRPQPNGSFLILNPKLGFSNHIDDNGIRVSETVRSGISFKAPEPLSLSLEDEQIEKSISSAVEEDGDETDKVVDLQVIVRGLELGRHDATALLFLVGIMAAAYGYVMLGFLVTYAWVLGIVFVTVVTDLLGRYKSFTKTVWDGSSLGLRRLSGFILMRWAVRDALTQLLGIWFFGEIEDQYSFFKIFVRLKLMPFSIMSPWVRGHERESAGFLLSWFLLDTLVAFVFAVDAWVAIVDSRKSGREVVKEGCYLLSTMLHPAVNIKCLEGIICGSFTRWMLSRFFGELFALAFQSVMEVYFMVAWLLFYFAARSKHAVSLGRTFGQRELEGFLEFIR